MTRDEIYLKIQLSEELTKLYLNSPILHRAIDTLRYTQEDDLDVVRVLFDVVVAVSKENMQLNRTIIKALQKGYIEGGAIG